MSDPVPEPVPDEPPAADEMVWPDLGVADQPADPAAPGPDTDVALPDFAAVDPTAADDAPPFEDAVALALAGVDLSPEGSQPVSGTVSLVDIATGRTLDIVMARPDAALVQEVLTGVAPPRPRAHDLLISAVELLDGTIDYVAIVERRAGGVYVASVGVKKPDGTTSVLDARPSDAVNLALRSHGASIWAATALLGVADN